MPQPGTSNGVRRYDKPGLRGHALSHECGNVKFIMRPAGNIPSSNLLPITLEHYENFKYYQSTNKAWVEVLQNLIVWIPGNDDKT